MAGNNMMPGGQKKGGFNVDQCGLSGVTGVFAGGVGWLFFDHFKKTFLFSLGGKMWVNVSRSE
jgi:hypothetical protein